MGSGKTRSFTTDVTENTDKAGDKYEFVSSSFHSAGTSRLIFLFRLIRVLRAIRGQIVGSLRLRSHLDLQDSVGWTVSELKSHIGQALADLSQDTMLVGQVLCHKGHAKPEKSPSLVPGHR